MMRDLPRPFVRTLAATFLGIGFAGLAPMVSWAQGAAPEPSGTAAPAGDTGTPPPTASPAPASTPPGAPENGARPSAPDPMGQRVNNYLHERLRITPAQEPLWASLTQVMGDNATALAPLLRMQFQARQDGNSIELLSAGEKLDAAQLDGLRKFIAAYQALYDSLSDEQRKIADFVFRRSQFAEGSSTPPGVLPGYLSAPPLSQHAAIPAYPAYPPVYFAPSSGPLFAVPFVGVAVGPRIGFHGHSGFPYPGVQHPGFQHPDFHAMPPPMHLSGGPVRIGTPSVHR